LNSSSSAVWKYSLAIQDVVEILLPEGAEVLCVAMQEGRPWLWARVDPKGPLRPRRFRVAGTGHELEPYVDRYIGTFQMLGGTLVFHVFEYPIHE
jgi:hypothetical protein